LVHTVGGQYEVKVASICRSNSFLLLRWKPLHPGGGLVWNRPKWKIHSKQIPEAII
jgi:hypothetical protein